MRYSREQKSDIAMRYQKGESVADICTETGLARSTIYSWLKPYHTTVTKAGTSITLQEFTFLKRRVEKLESIIKVLKSVNCTSSSPLQDRLKALEPLYGQFSTRTLCDALEVSRGTFYNHIFRNKKTNKSYQIRRAQLSEQIRQVYEENNQIYGAKKIKAVLAERGIVTSDKMVSELMQEMNISSISSGAKRNYLKFNAGKKKDKLKMDFSVSTPNQVWVSDVTIFKLSSKAYYICAILDLYSRKVISYKISQKQSAQLITSTFRLAYAERRPQRGLFFHSDRGSQYTSYAFQKLLKRCCVEQSFSPTGSPYHNAVMESFFSSLKREELYRRNYHSVIEFKDCVQKYIQFYNTERPHSTLRYKTPDAHESLYYSLQEGKTS